MHCHLCENSAIGVCRHCYKFYCATHGEGFCDTCQKKGWTTGENKPPVAVATMTREATIATTANAKVAAEAKEEEKLAAAGST